MDTLTHLTAMAIIGGIFVPKMGATIVAYETVRAARHETGLWATIKRASATTSSAYAVTTSAYAAYAIIFLGSLPPLR